MRVARPASGTHNNPDLLLWAFYLLNAADRWVDVEEAYLKAFELAPARLSWRTRPELPHFHKCASALHAIENETSSDHLGLIVKNGSHGRSYERRLTADGVRWCEEHQTLLSDLYSDGIVPSHAGQDDARRIRLIQQSAAYTEWALESEITCSIGQLADAFRCLANSPPGTWQSRFDEYTLAAERNGETNLLAFIEAARNRLIDDPDQTRLHLLDLDNLRRGPYPTEEEDS